MNDSVPVGQVNVPSATILPPTLIPNPPQSKVVPVAMFSTPAAVAFPPSVLVPPVAVDKLLNEAKAGIVCAPALLKTKVFPVEAKTAPVAVGLNTPATLIVPFASVTVAPPRAPLMVRLL